MTSQAQGEIKQLGWGRLEWGLQGWGIAGTFIATGDAVTASLGSVTYNSNEMLTLVHLQTIINSYYTAGLRKRNAFGLAEGSAGHQQDFHLQPLTRNS